MSSPCCWRHQPLPPRRLLPLFGVEDIPLAVSGDSHIVTDDRECLLVVGLFTDGPVLVVGCRGVGTSRPIGVTSVLVILARHKELLSSETHLTCLYRQRRLL